MTLLSVTRINNNVVRLFLTLFLPCDFVESVESRSHNASSLRTNERPPATRPPRPPPLVRLFARVLVFDDREKRPTKAQENDRSSRTPRILSEAGPLSL